jgi:hypothetical protein
MTTHSVAPVVGAPDPGEGMPSLDHVREAIRLLEAIVADRTLLAAIPDEQRKALLIAAGRVSRPEDHQQRRLIRAFRRARKQELESHDRALRATTEIRAARQSTVYVPPSRRLAAGASPTDDPVELKKPRTCYVCKGEFRRLHFFYDAMCPACAELNYAKRFQTASLEGRVALVTGARVKIGYQASLKILPGSSPPRASPATPRGATRERTISSSGGIGSRFTVWICATLRASSSSPAISSRRRTGSTSS